MPIAFIFTGPSGAGKTTILSKVLQKFKDKAARPVTCTTRPPRAGEVDGVDYHFFSHEKFHELIEAGEFLEYATCHENMYGSLKRSVYDVLEARPCCILEYDYTGTRNVLHNNLLDVEAVGIGIFPSSIKHLRARLVRRNSETEETLDIRLSAAFNQPCVPYLKYVIINRILEESVDELCSIINRHIE